MKFQTQIGVAYKIQRDGIYKGYTFISKSDLESIRNNVIDISTNKIKSHACDYLDKYNIDICMKEGEVHLIIQDTLLSISEILILSELFRVNLEGTYTCFKIDTNYTVVISKSSIAFIGVDLSHTSMIVTSEDFRNALLKYIDSNDKIINLKKTSYGVLYEVTEHRHSEETVILYLTKEIMNKFIKELDYIIGE